MKYHTFVSANRHLPNCTLIRQTIDVGLKGLIGMSRIAIEFQVVSIERGFSNEKAETNIRNRMGPNTHPCGTLLTTALVKDNVFPAFTWKDLLFR